VTDFQNSFTGRLARKFRTNLHGRAGTEGNVILLDELVLN